LAHTFSYPTINPLDPDGAKAEVIFEGNLALYWYKHLPVQYQNLQVVKEVLDNPKRIFSKIRPITRGGWCYVGRPKIWYVAENCTASFPEDRVFAVFLNDRKVVYTFRAEFADGEDPLSPKDWKNRFGGLVWKSTS